MFIFGVLRFQATENCSDENSVFSPSVFIVQELFAVMFIGAGLANEISTFRFEEKFAHSCGRVKL